MKVNTSPLCRLVAMGLAWMAAATAAPAAATSSPAGEEAGQTILKTVSALADQKSAFVKAFARKVCEALMRNKFPLPRELSDIAVPTGRQDPLSDEDLRNIYELTDQIVRLCRVTPHSAGLPVSLQLEILDAVVQSCPSSLSRMETALFLAEQARRENDPRHTLPIPPAVASDALRTALYYCFDHTHCAWITDDDVRALQSARAFKLFDNYIYLKTMAEPNLTVESLDKSLAEMAETLDNASAQSQGLKGDGASAAVAALADQLKRSRAGAAQIVGFAQARREIQDLVVAFLDAVNREDKDAACRCLTPATAAALRSRESLKETIAPHGTKRIDFRTMSLPAAAPKGFTVDVGLTVVDAAGTATDAHPTPFRLVKTPNGWRIGQP